jgi:hypothetical protein
LTRLLAWAKENGAELEKISPLHHQQCTPKQRQRGFGLTLRTDVEAGVNLMSIPFRLCMSSNSSLTPSLSSFVDEFPPFIRLIIRLLDERRKGSTSFWLPYIDTLPRDYYSTNFLKEPELHFLHGTSAEHKSGEHALAATKAYLKYVSKPNGLSGTHPQEFPAAFYTMENWLWAFSTVTSRAFKNEEGITLVPILDLANHGPRKGLRNRNQFIRRDPVAERRFVYTAAQQQAGEEWLNDYGAIANDQLLIDYGFVLDENADDFYQLAFKLPDPGGRHSELMKVRIGLLIERLVSMNRLHARS